MESKYFDRELLRQEKFLVVEKFCRFGVRKAEARAASQQQHLYDHRNECQTSLETFIAVHLLASLLQDRKFPHPPLGARK